MSGVLTVYLRKRNKIRLSLTISKHWVYFAPVSSKWPKKWSFVLPKWIYDRIISRVFIKPLTSNGGPFNVIGSYSEELSTKSIWFSIRIELGVMCYKRILQFFEYFPNLKFLCHYSKKCRYLFIWLPYCSIKLTWIVRYSISSWRSIDNLRKWQQWQYLDIELIPWNCVRARVSCHNRDIDMICTFAHCPKRIHQMKVHCKHGLDQLINNLSQVSKM